MHPRVAKDIRLVLPAWLLTAALMIATVLLPHGSEWAATVLVFGCLIIPASIFGGEYGHGTVSQLLTQPIDRRRIWYGKMLVLAVSLGLLLIAMLWIVRPTWPLAVVAVCAFCTVPFFTLEGRSTMAGVLLSVPIPGAIFVVGGILILWVLRSVEAEPSNYEAFNEQRLHFWIRAYFGIVLPIYCAVVYYLGYRRFRRLEITGLSERHVRLPKSMQNLYECVLGRLLSDRHRSLRALISKELHFQHNAILLALLFAVLQILAVLYIKLAQPSDPELYFIIPLFIYSTLMPLIIGSSAIAEEQNLGTRVWHLTLPCSIRMQWFIKVAVVFFFAVLFGIAVPLFLWTAIGGVIVPDWEWPDGVTLGLFCCAVLLITVVGFYASSFARDTVRALLTAVGLPVALGFILFWLGYAVEHSSLRSGGLFLPLLRHLNAPAVASVLMSAWLWIGLPVLCLFMLLLLGSLKHFRTLDHSPARIGSNMLLVFLPPIALFFFLLNLGFAAGRFRLIEYLQP